MVGYNLSNLKVHM